MTAPSRRGIRLRMSPEPVGRRRKRCWSPLSRCCRSADHGRQRAGTTGASLWAIRLFRGFVGLALKRGAAVPGESLMVRVMIVGDEALIRSGLTLILQFPRRHRGRGEHRRRPGGRRGAPAPPGPPAPGSADAGGRRAHGPAPAGCRARSPGGDGAEDLRRRRVRRPSAECRSCGFPAQGHRTGAVGTRRPRRTPRHCWPSQARIDRRSSSSCSSLWWGATRAILWVNSPMSGG